MQTQTDTPTENHTEAGQRNPLDAFIVEATRPPRELKTAQIPKFREQAMEELERRYGAFTPEVAEQVADPVHRLMILAELANNGWGFTRTMDKLRTDRRNAIGVLRYHFDWKPMRVIRLLKADPKRRRIVDFAVAVSDRKNLPNWTEERAVEVAKAAHDGCVERERYAELARPPRDELIVAMSRGQGGDAWGDDGGPRVWSNAELARLSRLTPAAITQLCNGTAPSARRAASEA
jgi:hypothetical protein